MEGNKRFCLQCEEVTIFKYERKIGHSRCKKCGGWRARRVKEFDE